MRSFWLWFGVIVLFVLLAVPFLIPSYTAECSDKLFMCIEQGKNTTIWKQLWAHLGCVYDNVICVLGGLFR